MIGIKKDKISREAMDAYLDGYKWGVMPWLTPQNNWMETKYWMDYIQGLFDGSWDFEEIEEHLEYCIKNDIATDDYIDQCQAN